MTGMQSMLGGTAFAGGVTSLLLTSILMAGPAAATEYSKETPLSYVGAQGVRPIQPSTENTAWVNFAGSVTWTVSGGSGGAACADGAAVIPMDNKMLQAVALAAIASGAAVLVTVDNSLPMYGAYCQVTSMYIKSGG